ncbi:MAG: methyltransferase domain-containing protein [Desulfovibrio sp.]|jgi:ubiquinone/menaquinone biosynthesis C-methylase UbiE|nr:methyltransferase domain-containing protein [Desulfovibrio sp.]
MFSESERDRRRSSFFDQAAEGWEERNYPPEIMARTEELISGLGIAPGLTILDAGCGRGVILPVLRGISGPKARLLALDASASMLGGVAAKDPDAVAIHARAEEIPLIDAYVDLVLCFSAFPHFSDHPAVAREFFRVLKAGGRAYVLHLAGSETIRRHHEGHPAVHGDSMPSAKGMEAMFAEAGFSRLTLTDAEDRYVFSALKP